MTQRQEKLIENYVRQKVKKMLKEESEMFSVQFTPDELFGVWKLLDYISEKISASTISKISQGLDLDALFAVRKKLKRKYLSGSYRNGVKMQQDN